jgi:predicted nucleic acid-binding protein
MKRNFEDEDIKQEALAYIKTKTFMARRIFEQQSEIETLKEQLFEMNVKYMKLFESHKLLANQISNHLKQENLSVSGDLTNSIELDDPKDKDNGNTLNIASEFSADFLVLDEKKNFGNLLQQFKIESIEMGKEVEALRLENSLKDLTINKLNSDKLLLFNELSELVFGLKKMNLEVLNKIYKDTVTPKSITSGLGIRMNIMSACNQLSMVSVNSNSEIDVNSCMHVIKKFEDEINKII